MSYRETLCRIGLHEWVLDRGLFRFDLVWQCKHCAYEKRKGGTMKWYYYQDSENGGVIRIIARTRPSFKQAQRSRRPWVCQEYNGKRWVMPSFPEITWTRIERLQYIGSVGEAQ